MRRLEEKPINVSLFQQTRSKGVGMDNSFFIIDDYLDRLGYLLSTVDETGTKSKRSASKKPVAFPYAYKMKKKRNAKKREQFNWKELAAILIEPSPAQLSN